MKSKLFAAAVFAVFIFSCSPKIAVTAQQPNPVQVPPKMASPNEAPVNSELAAGHTLYDNNCAKCHRLFAPSEFSKQEWEPILVRMQKKARLDDPEMARISAYVFSLAK